MKKEAEKLKLPDSILGVSLSDNQKEIIRSGKETELIKGFTNRNGDHFDAHVSLNSENKFVFRTLDGKTKSFHERNSHLNEVENEIEKLIDKVDFIKFAAFSGFTPVSAKKNELGIFEPGREIYTGDEYALLENGLGTLIAIYLQKNLSYHFVQIGRPSISGGLRAFFQQFTSPFPSDFLATLNRSRLSEKGKNEKSEKEDLVLKEDQVRKNNSILKLIPHKIPVEYDQVFMTVFGLEKLNTREWFYDSQIKDSSIDHTFFRNRILSFKSSTTKKSSALEPVFPLFTDESIGGFAYPLLDEGNHSYSTRNLKVSGEGVWLSNIINEEKIRRLVIVSHPMEALAYHQMYAKPSDLMSLYMSCCSGNTVKDAYWAQKIIDRYKPEQVIIATERNERGIFISTYLLGQLSEPRQLLKEKNTFRVENSEIRFGLELLSNRNNEFACLSVTLNYLDFEKGLFMNENLVKYFDQINHREISEHEELGEVLPFEVKLKQVAKHSSLAEIIFPVHKGLLATAEKIVQHLRPLLFLKSEYPLSLSYLEDLKINNEQRMTSKDGRRKTG